MSKMIFAAFESEGRTRAAIDRLRGDGFKDGGISLLARQDFRDRTPPGGFKDGPDQSTLDPMIESMTVAPDLKVDNHEVAGVGALPNLLKPGPDAGLGGLKAAFVEAGVDEGTAAEFEAKVRERGFILGVAAENPQRSHAAHKILDNEGAHAVAELDVVEQRRDVP